MKQPLVVIVGPTAVGKSSAAVEVADQLNGEIISADSMQVYRGMNVGTAKLSEEDMIASSGRYIPHHLLDVTSPLETYSVAKFQQDARRLIKEIGQRNKLPMLVGGTGLYIQSAIDEYQFEEQRGDDSIRNKIKDDIQQQGREAVYRRLQQLDPPAAEKIHPNDEKRIIRALEYYDSTGEKISDNQQKFTDSPYQLAMVGLTMDRSQLYQRINVRVDQMIDQGLVDEVKTLINMGCVGNMPAMQGLGYKQVASYLSGAVEWEESVRLLKRDTRRFAKRQLTWFRRDERIHWIDVTGLHRAVVIGKIVKYVCRSLKKVVE